MWLGEWLRQETNTHYKTKARNYIRIVKLEIQARFALACAARLADTLCPPEAPFGRLESHWLIIREITSLNMSVLLC